MQDLAPRMAKEGDPAFTLRLFGAGFTTRSVVEFNSVALATKFETKGVLMADVPTSLLASPGTRRVSVSNPSSLGGGTKRSGVQDWVKGRLLAA